MSKAWELMTFYDKVLIVIIAIISLSFIFFPNIFLNQNTKEDEYIIVIKTADGKQKQIKINETYQRESLIIEADGPIGITIIEAHNGRVRVKKAPPADPLRIDEKIGWISEPGPSIICVPNKLAIWIEESESEQVLDGMSW